jgi:hypothetical protein
MTMAKKDRDIIAALAAEGYSAGEVAARLGSSRNAILGEAHRAGIKFFGRQRLRKPITTEQLAAAAKWMRRHGATYSEIGEIFGRDVSYVFSIANRDRSASAAKIAPPPTTPAPTPAPQPSKWLQYAQQVAAGVEPEAWPA